MLFRSSFHHGFPFGLMIGGNKECGFPYDDKYSKILPSNSCQNQFLIKRKDGNVDWEKLEKIVTKFILQFNIGHMSLNNGLEFNS